jgi:hypothetical protein
MDRDNGRCAPIDSLDEVVDESEERLDKEGPHARVRARTISIKRLSKRELERGKQAYPETGYPKPKTRADCAQGEFAARPCPFVSCKYHLLLDVSERTGAIKLNFPDLEVWDLPESCALDIADRGGVTLEEVGVLMNLTRERIRQLEAKGLARLKALNELAALQDFLDEPSDAPNAYAKSKQHIPVTYYRQLGQR